MLKKEDFVLNDLDGSFYFSCRLGHAIRFLVLFILKLGKLSLVILFVPLSPVLTPDLLLVLNDQIVPCVYFVVIALQLPTLKSALALTFRLQRASLIFCFHFLSRLFIIYF